MAAESTGIAHATGSPNRLKKNDSSRTLLKKESNPGLETVFGTRAAVEIRSESLSVHLGSFLACKTSAKCCVLYGCHSATTGSSSRAPNITESDETCPFKDMGRASDVASHSAIQAYADEHRNIRSSYSLLRWVFDPMGCCSGIGEIDGSPARFSWLHSVERGGRPATTLAHL